MSTRTFFTSDLHLGHANIIRYCDRPFSDVRAMDRALIDGWNAVVRDVDEVWVVGDFCISRHRSAQSYLSELNGNKHLVRGNHDKHDTVTASGWSSVQDIAQIDVDKRRVVLCHFGMRTWPRIGRGAVMLHGHSHGRLPGLRTSSGGGTCDVGVDVWLFRPVMLGEVLSRIARLSQVGEFGEERDQRDRNKFCLFRQSKREVT